MTKPLLTIEQNVELDNLGKELEKLTKKAVYVGIARGSDKDTRNDDAPNNSDLGYIHEFGEPSKNIPARPFLRPSMEQYKDVITNDLSKAITEALNGEKRKANETLEKLAIKCASKVKLYMRTADFIPLSPYTIQNRWKNQGRGMRKAEIEMDVGNIRPLIDTGALLGAVDGYVIEE